MNATRRINRRQFLECSILLGGAALGLPTGAPGRLLPKAPAKPQPVILATDIGDDIDDTWALGLLLKSPELDLKLALTEYGKARYRAKLLAKFLETTGHAHIPVGVGPDVEPRGEGAQAAWVKDYNLGQYPGQIHADGIQAMIDTIMQSRTPVTVISIGPMPNIAAALERAPRIASRARFVGMDGSVRIGYGGSPTPSAEWNVKADTKAAQHALAAGWAITITPLDTCGLVDLQGDPYRRVAQSSDPIAATILQNYRLWSQANPSIDPAHRSTVLFDTVAVYLAFARELCQIERMRIRVSEDGFTRVDQRGKAMDVATGWKSLESFRELLVARLAGA